MSIEGFHEVNVYLAEDNVLPPYFTGRDVIFGGRDACSAPLSLHDSHIPYNCKE